MPYFTSYYLTLSYHILPDLPYPTLPYPTLPYPAHCTIAYFTLHNITLPNVTLPCITYPLPTWLCAYLQTGLPSDLHAYQFTPHLLRAYQITTLPIHLATSGAIIGDLIIYTHHQRTCAQVSV